MTPTVRAAIYTRISNDPTSKQAGVTRQLKDCRALAKRIGVTVVAHYDDNDMSAYSGQRRPGFEAMLTAVAAGEFTVILSYHPDRIYRSMKDLERLIDVADAANVSIRTVNGGDIDLSTAAGKMVARILGSVARQESEHKGERQRSANTARRDAARWQGFGDPPFGYVKSRDSDGHLTLVRDEPAATLLVQAAAEILAGGSLRAVAAEWNAAGMTTRRGRPWAALSVKQVLTNPVLAALVCAPHPRTGTRSHVGRAVIARGGWEPIFDETTHRALLTLLHDPARRTSVSLERKHMGSGVYECGVCGSKLWAGSSGGVPTYVCPTGSHVARKMAPVDEMVTKTVLAVLAKSGIEAALAAAANGEGPDVGAATVRRNAAEIRLTELAKLFAAGDIDAAQLAAATKQLREQITDADRECAQARASTPAAALLSGNPDAAERERRWESATPDIKGKIVDELMTVTVQKVRRGSRFDPGAVAITPKVA